MLQFDFNGTLINEYGSGRVFAKENNINNWRHLRSAANGKRDSAFGFIWIYKTDYTDKLLHEKVEKINKNLSIGNTKNFYKNKGSVIEAPPVNINE